jgi:hypothetical protein
VFRRHATLTLRRRRSPGVTPSGRFGEAAGGGFGPCLLPGGPKPPTSGSRLALGVNHQPPWVIDGNGEPAWIDSPEGLDACRMRRARRSRPVSLDGGLPVPGRVTRGGRPRPGRVDVEPAPLQAVHVARAPVSLGGDSRHARGVRRPYPLRHDEGRRLQGLPCEPAAFRSRPPRLLARGVGVRLRPASPRSQWALTPN